MPIFINGLMLPEELIRQEAENLNSHPAYSAIADPVERAQRVRVVAEESAINRMLLDHAAAVDKRPIDAGLLEQEVQRQKTAGGIRNAFDDTALRTHTERWLRVGRIANEFTADAPKPSLAEVESFYAANQENFRSVPSFGAAHIVCHVDEAHSEEQARQRIEAALAALETGESFVVVAEQFSDCKGNGGSLGVFPKGTMVPEFEDAICALEVGQRTGIFSTPFGFHIAELQGRSDNRPAGFDDVREDIEKVLTAMRQHELFLKGIESLRQKAEIRWAPAPSTSSASNGHP